MGKQLAWPPGTPRPLCVYFTVGAYTHPSCNVIAILRAIGGPVRTFVEVGRRRKCLMITEDSRMCWTWADRTGIRLVRWDRAREKVLSRSDRAFSY